MAHGKRKPLGSHPEVRSPHVDKAVRDLPMCLERINPSPFRQGVHRASLLRIGLGDQNVKYGNGQNCTVNYLARHGGLECPCRQEDYMSNELQLHIINAAESRRLRQSNSLKGPASHKSDNVHPKVPANFAKRIMNYPKGPALLANQIICMRGSLQLS